MNRLIDILLGTAITMMIGFGIYLAVRDIPYSCFDGSIKPGYGRYIEVKNCEYKDYQWHCDEGVYTYCHEENFDFGRWFRELHQAGSQGEGTPLLEGAFFFQSP